MSTELQAAPVSALVPSGMPNLRELQRASDFGDKKSDDVFGQGFNFLPRLQLFGGSSDEVKTGAIPIGHYGIVKFGEDKVIPVGNSVLISPLVYRTKAMALKTIDGKPESYFDKESPEFKNIVALSANPKSGNVYGPEFLVWAGPQWGFLTFFMNNITMRNEAPSVRALCPREDGSWRTGLLTSILIRKEAENQSWHGPKIALSSQTLEYPDPAMTDQTVALFLKPTPSAPKAAATLAPAGAAASADER